MQEPAPPSGGPTKDEIMAISLQKLGLREGDIFADVGCGTGKVSLCAAPSVLKVFAIDRRKEAIRYASHDAGKQGVKNIEFFTGDAARVLPGLFPIDTAFVGGSRDLEQTLEILARGGVRSVVVNAVMIETMHLAIKTMQRLGIFSEALSVQVSRTASIGNGLMFRPIDPVYIIVGGEPVC
ncbi:cobalt-precorrin-6B (C15)-methyltransferase [Methanolinea mesophila]|uniref:bifunctional cobalt-precorrin-7 (C(5))-methyltransferase/cobalt-precorrin-6B (C(15))-methyltransferase n=1 Tax=Methanolinea mesophila TaxID=547055 RepID=UPI001AE88BEA|nr:methyltransferase domain-containing protein [Methanolinea mesophila]MBP1929610.1 cobalt-precorrin-6B (C15)-methyltransferase [Methanolinea mesophila]